MPDFNFDDPWFNEPGFDAPVDGGFPPPYGEDFPLPDAGNQTDPYESGTGGYSSPGYDSGSGAGSLGSLMKLLGLSGKDGNMNSSGLMQLLSMLGMGAGGLMSYNATNKASDQMVGATKEANDAITKILGGASAGYDPYTKAGAGAVGNLQNIGYKPMAGNFRPLGSGAGMTLGNMIGGRNGR